MELRPYQLEAIDAVYDYLRNNRDNPCVVMPTGSGKGLVIATICRDAVVQWSGRVLILSHVKELLEQTADKLQRICPEVSFGIYSAGLKRRDTKQDVILAGIQSIYQRACDLEAFDLILVDEAHLLSPDGEGMYRTFLKDAQVINPQVRVIGLTATPYRMKSGLICQPDHFLNSVCYEVGIRELIHNGYLCPLVTKAGRAKADTSELHVRGGEYVPGEVEDLMDTDELVEAACLEIVEKTSDRQSVLIFSSGIQHGEHVVRILKEQHGIDCGFVSGSTSSGEREELLKRFRREQNGLLPLEPLKYLCNVNVLTTGFDAPNVDCIAILRPTMSPGLLVQIAGRGFRLHPGKENCLILDFGGNVQRHGPIDQIRVKNRNAAGDGAAPAKECPECHSVIAAGYSTCPDCGHVFPEPQRAAHAASASDAGILTGQVTDTEHAVQDVVYRVHQKRDAPEDAPRTMRVSYRIGFHQWQSEFICLEHSGYARAKAVDWWKRRTSVPVPDSADLAVALAQEGVLCDTISIMIRSIAGEKYDQITGWDLGPVPELDEVGELCELVAEDIPF